MFCLLNLILKYSTRKTKVAAENPKNIIKQS